MWPRPRPVCARRRLARPGRAPAPPGPQRILRDSRAHCYEREALQRTRSSWHTGPLGAQPPQRILQLHVVRQRRRWLGQLVFVEVAATDAGDFIRQCELQRRARTALAIENDAADE